MASQRALLQWLNDKLGTEMKSITQMGEGWQYCQLADMVIPRAVPASRVIVNARNEEQKLLNFKLFTTFLSKQSAAYPAEAVDVQKVVKGNQTHNLSLLSWYKKWHDDMTDGEVATPRKPRSTVMATPSRKRKAASVFEAPPPVCVPAVDAAPLTQPTTSAATAVAAPAAAGAGDLASTGPPATAASGPAMRFLMRHQFQGAAAAKRPRVATSAAAAADDAAAAAAPRAEQHVAAAHAAAAAAAADAAAVQKLREEAKKAQDEVKRKSFEEAKLQKHVRELEARLEAVQDTEREADERVRHAERQLRQAREEKQKHESELRDWKEKVTAMQESMENATSQLREKDATLEKAAAVRRMLHNSLQELKGNIRVFARVRPTLDGEEATDGTFTFPDVLDSRSILVTEPEAASVTGEMKQGKATTFEYDKIFTPTSQQSEVFAEVSNLVQSCLDGYKVCLFAYGQTGSGKTHTMEGTAVDHGLIPRAVQLLFERSKEMSAQGWDMSLKARYVEIYNDKLRDLLEDGSSTAKIEVHHGKHGTEDDTHLTNCTLVDVEDSHSVLRILEKAKSKRTVTTTKMNERSSRSHSVFTLKIYGRNAGTAQQMASEINLIDLAGSERVKASGVTGEALKEAEHINTSLTHLGNVIQQLNSQKAKPDKSKQNHIFRNSTLTWLLKSCLGGDCKTLMLVNISPALASLQETISSLRFATKVNNCLIGTATRRVR